VLFLQFLYKNATAKKSGHQKWSGRFSPKITFSVKFHATFAAKFIFSHFCFKILIVLMAVLRIHDILGWIRILVSMPLTNGSGSWIRILLFASLTFKMPANKFFNTIFSAYYF
jgi:hypothetical protein